MNLIILSKNSVTEIVVQSQPAAAGCKSMSAVGGTNAGDGKGGGKNDGEVAMRRLTEFDDIRLPSVLVIHVHVVLREVPSTIFYITGKLHVQIEVLVNYMYM